MAKDTIKNKYLNIGLARDSWVLGELESDATLHQMGDQPAKMAAVRLTEYYRLVKQKIIIPGITVLGPEREEEASKVRESVDPPTQRVRSKSIPNTSAPTKEFLGESAALNNNADAMLDYFTDDE